VSEFDIGYGEEIVVDHTSPQGPVVLSVRGSLVVTFLRSLREGGYFDQYVELLPAEHREALVQASAVSWLPIDLVVEHCRACDQLGLSESQLLALGASTAEGMATTTLSALMRTAGATPLTMMSTSFARVWDRTFEGGRVSVRRNGPKDCVLEFSGMPLASSPYYRLTSRGFYQALAARLSKSAYANLVRTSSPATSLAIALSWV
jgi:hypothetical protein